MSRRHRARAAHDKRTTALDLARFMGHGTPMPSSEEDEPGEDWSDDAPAPDHRIPIGPTDCQPLNSERHA